MVETNLDRKALSEVYSVLIKLDKSDFEKIPKDLIDAIELNLDENYEVNDFEIENGKMLEETEKILAVIYLDYLANEEEKQIVNKLQIIENLKKKNTEETSISNIVKNNFFNNILDKIKKFLGGHFGRRVD